VLFPRLAGLHVEGVSTRGSRVCVEARAQACRVRCPGCSTASGRVHSRYERRIADRAVGGREAVIHLRVRRFFCINAGCGRKTFVEQIPGLTVRHGRHSVLARQVLEATALAFGGRAGARLTRHLALGVGLPRRSWYAPLRLRVGHLVRSGQTRLAGDRCHGQPERGDNQHRDSTCGPALVRGGGAAGVVSWYGGPVTKGASGSLRPRAMVCVPGTGRARPASARRAP
jgi:hypothetical protein